MSYEKKALTLPELVKHLQGIGLQGEPCVIEERIRDVGYFRLSPYWRYYRVGGKDAGSQLKDGTTIDDVWQLYVFDRELRLLLLDAIERVEVGVRARLVQSHVEKHGPFGYARRDVFGLRTKGRKNQVNQSRYEELLTTIADTLSRASAEIDHRRASQAMRHFATRHGSSHAHPPLWLAAEVFSIGDLVTLYKGSPGPIRKGLSHGFEIPEPVFESWLLCLQAVRNICAHHGRIWNRTLGVQPAEPDNSFRWAAAELGPRDRIFYTITILAYCMSILCDGSHWGERFRELVEEKHAHVPPRQMGIRGAWQSHAVWAHCLGGGVGRVPPEESNTAMGRALRTRSAKQG